VSKSVFVDGGQLLLASLLRWTPLPDTLLKGLVYTALLGRRAARISPRPGARGRL